MAVKHELCYSLYFPDLLCTWYVVCAQLLFFEFLKEETKLSYVVLVGQGLRPTASWRI